MLLPLAHFVHEVELTASRSSGPGGQHVNKSDTRITARWNIPASGVLTPNKSSYLRKS